MPPGFFKPQELASHRPPPSLVAQCGACGLYKVCRSPKMAVDGDGRRKILVVGEAPGRNEDEQNRPFVGESGSLVRAAFEKFGVNFRRDCWITNAVICRPPKNDLPPKAIDYCRPNLIKTVQELKPEVIILLGASAVKGLIGWLWKEDVGSLGRWIGWKIPSRRLNAWVCPTWHPSYLLRDAAGSDNPLTQMLWEQHLEQALTMEGRPYEPTFREPTVQVLLQPSVIAEKVLALRGDGPVAIDYETDRLKPDPADSRIISCALSDGGTTLAFPWLPEAARAVKALLKSDTPLIASNAKFEVRWSKRHLKTAGRCWYWDTMLAAHVLDNRGDICSIKFQAFVLLGVEQWDARVKPYMKGECANAPNRLREVALDKLLHYNGLDALYEWEVAVVQRKLMGLSWP